MGGLTDPASGIWVCLHQLDVGVHHLLHQLLQRDTGQHFILNKRWEGFCTGWQLSFDENNMKEPQIVTIMCWFNSFTLCFIAGLLLMKPPTLIQWASQNLRMNDVRAGQKESFYREICYISQTWHPKSGIVLTISQTIRDSLWSYHVIVLSISAGNKLKANKLTPKIALPISWTQFISLNITLIGFYTWFLLLLFFIQLHAFHNKGKYFFVHPIKHTIGSYQADVRHNVSGRPVLVLVANLLEILCCSQ